MTPDPVDQQVEQLLSAVRGKRVGLLTNPSGVDNHLNMIADILDADPNTTVTAFFAPEHGLRGDVQAGGGVTDYIDPYTSIPVYSVYRVRKAPTDEQLAQIDVLISDKQDVGSRFYTFMWTMTYAMEACAKNHKKFIVFDRPNPIGADRVEGAPITWDAGLVGRVWPGQPFGVATRHGMTEGEIASMVNSEWLDPKADLQVIKIPGYTRSTTFEETHRPWVLPSPNMPTIDTATVYPGLCVFEGVNVSEGRGTTKPFEIIGAPFINGVELARDLNALNLPGVRFRPAYFVPSFADYKGEQCGGVQVHVTDRKTFDPIRTALFMLKTIYEKYPDKVQTRSYVATLMGVPNLHERIKSESVDSIIAGWQENLEAFKKIRAKYLIYP
ncbi:MAG: DUF1343 domain-containing protein [bacterium]